MRFFNVYDNIEGKIKKYYYIDEAREEAQRLLRIYIKLSSKVRCKEKDGNQYIYLKEE